MFKNSSPEGRKATKDYTREVMKLSPFVVIDYQRMDAIYRMLSKVLGKHSSVIVISASQQCCCCYR